MRSYYVPSTALNTRDVVVRKAVEVSLLTEITFQWRNTEVN